MFWIEASEHLQGLGPIQSFKAHDGPVAGIQVDTTKAISCGLHDNAVAISDVIKGHVLQTLRGHAASILVVAFDDKEIMSVSSDGELRHWIWERENRSKSKRRKAIKS